MIHIEELENLPLKESIRHPHDQWHIWRGWRHNINGQSVYKILDRVLANNINKSFSLAFSYFCTKVPKYQQILFLDVFTEDRYWKHRNFYIDSNDNIQIKEPFNKYKGSYKIYSDDYKIMYRQKKVKWHWKLQDKDKLSYWDDPNDYEKIVYGQIFEFASKKDPVYIAHKRKQAQKYKLQARLHKQEKQRKFDELESILKTKKNEKKAKERELDLLKCNAHGFDDESFKGGTYHGRKNKRK